MGWNHPNPIYYNSYVSDNPWGWSEFIIMSCIIWIIFGIIPSLIISFLLFPPEEVGLMIPLVIYFIGIAFFVFVYIQLDKAELRKGKKTRKKIARKKYLE
jgi:hypothetical protein